MLNRRPVANFDRARQTHEMCRAAAPEPELRPGLRLSIDPLFDLNIDGVEPAYLDDEGPMVPRAVPDPVRQAARPAEVTPPDGESPWARLRASVDALSAAVDRMAEADRLGFETIDAGLRRAASPAGGAA